MKKLASLLLAATACAYGIDIENNTVSVSVLRTVPYAQLISFYVALLTPATTGLDEVVPVLAPSGITATDLTEVSKPEGIVGGVAVIQWTFSRRISLDRFSSTIQALKGIQAKLEPVNRVPALRFQVYSSYAYEGAPCDYSGLLPEARRQAENIAAVAGRSVGSIVSLSDGSSLEPGVPVLVQSASLGSGYGLGYIYIPTYSCTMTVQFKLL